MTRHHQAIAAGIVLIPLLAVIDYVTGFELNFFVFYFAPVTLLAWAGGQRLGLIGAAVCACAWLAVDLHSRTYSHIGYNAWNAGIRFVAFASLAWAVARMRSDQRELENLNRQLSVTIRELKESQDRIAVLRENVQMVCAWTKRIKSEGRWIRFEEFLDRYFQIRVSHGISEEGLAQLKAEMNQAESTEPPSDARPTDHA